MGWCFGIGGVSCIRNAATDMVPAQRSISGRGIGFFLLLVAVCIGINIAGHMFFPGANTIPRAIRALLSCVGLVVLAVGSEHLVPKPFGITSTLGIKLSTRSIRGMILGALGGIMLVAVCGGVFWLLVPFHFERTSITLLQILPDVQNYLFSNIGEELIFRGYFLLLLARRFGLSVALCTTAVLFGLFHLPGMNGLPAVKMVFTTAACSFLFAGAFLATRMRWTAIALHFVGNVVLHKITGLSNGDALLKPVLHEAYPAHYDPGFWVFLIVPLLLAFALFAFRRRHSKYALDAQVSEPIRGTSPERSTS